MENKIIYFIILVLSLISISVNAQILYIRANTDGDTTSINPDNLSFSPMLNADYSILSTGYTNVDTMYSLAYLSKSISSFLIKVENDDGDNLVGTFNWLAIGFGEFELGNSNYIKCGEEGESQTNSIVFENPFPDTSYSALCSPADDSDSPICYISENANPKTAAGFDTFVNDDGGGLETVNSTSWCAFSHGSYSIDSLNISAGTDTQGSSELVGNFTTPFNNADYVVIITNVEDGAQDGCVCEITSRSTIGFTGVCVDDISSASNCNSEVFDWVALNTIDSNVDVDPWWNGSWAKCSNLTVSSAIANYEYRVLFNSSNIDFSSTDDQGDDLRIVNAPCGNGGTEMNYWIEDWDETGDGEVWFKGDSSGSTTVYSVYYDYASAPTVSNGTATFMAFEDFSTLPTIIGVDWDGDSCDNYHIFGFNFSQSENYIYEVEYNITSVLPATFGVLSQFWFTNATRADNMGDLEIILTLI